MDTKKQISEFIASQPAPKNEELQLLHQRILKLLPKCKLWFLDGRDDKGKLVTNPNIGYGFQVMKLAQGKTREFYQIGISPNTAGISVYILGLKDKNHLAKSYGKKIGKASVTGYCIKFKSVEDIKLEVLDAAIKDGVKQTS